MCLDKEIAFSRNHNNIDQDASDGLLPTKSVTAARPLFAVSPERVVDTAVS